MQCPRCHSANTVSNGARRLVSQRDLVGGKAVKIKLETSQRLCRDCGASYRYPGKHQPLSERLERWLKFLVESGMTPKEVIAETGLPKSQYYAWIKDYQARAHQA